MSSVTRSGDISQIANNECEFKVVMVGTIGVGKTSVSCRYAKDTFREFVNTTIGASYMWKKEVVDGHELKFSVWDTAGQEQFHALVPMYFREADAVILVVDVTRTTCLEEATMWLEKIRASAPPHTVVFLALNKCDLPKVFTIGDARMFCDENDVLCAEVSAKTAAGVTDMFHAIGPRVPKETAGARRSPPTGFHSTE